MKSFRTSSLRQKAQITLALGGFTGVPLGLTGTRVPAASAFLCSREILSFLEMGIMDSLDDGKYLAKGYWSEVEYMINQLCRCNEKKVK